MFRIGVVICLILVSCKGKKNTEEEGKGFSYAKFSTLFRTITLPYQLSDTGLINNKDTTLIRTQEFSNFVADSIEIKIFGKGNKVRYAALGQIKLSPENSFYLVKASSGNKKTAFLLMFEKEQFITSFPFLIPDSDPSTSQSSTIDRSFTITKNIVQRKPGNIIGEGKDVYGYDAESKIFSLVLTDPLEGYTDLTNPIDTFPRRHKFAGDYGKDKKNLVSIRDGRNPNQLIIFIHMEAKEGSCTGELKGDLLLTSPTTAIYRQGGDPCVLSFRFTNASVTVKEDEGCGSRRGLDCSFDGTFNRKKQQKQKPSVKKPQVK